MKHSRGWWQPTLAELREARRNARIIERRKRIRDLSRNSGSNRIGPLSPPEARAFIFSRPMWKE
jgi:hypothetical protein